MISRQTTTYRWLLAAAVLLLGDVASTQATVISFGTFAAHNPGSVTAAMANVPTNVGIVYDANCNTNDINVVNFGTTVYTGPVDVSLTLARIRALKCETQESNDGGFFNPTGTEVPQVTRHPENANYYMEFVVWYAINTNAWTYDTGNLPYPGVTYPGPMRLLIGAGGEVYFTGDHYVSAYYVNPRPCAVSGNPDLAISKSHTGNFTQGDAGDTYSIVVTNVGTSASSNTVTVTDSMPAGLTATAISGTGWTTTLATLTASRTNALAAGASYPPITITVNVSSNAPTSVTNSVSVSGGGDTNAGNNTATDPTTINPIPGQLGVSPGSGLSFGGTVGGPFSPSSQLYTLTNSGHASLNWSTGNSRAWLSRSATSGSLAAGAASNITFSINNNATNLAANTYVDTITFTNTTTGAGNTTRSVTLTITNPPPGQLFVTPTSAVNAAGPQGGPFAPGTQTYVLTNSGGASISWSASVDNNWLSLSSSSGSLAAGAVTNIVISTNANTAALVAGVYSNQVNFVNLTNGNGSTNAVWSINVMAPASLAVTPLTTTSMAGEQGGPFLPSIQTYTLSNTGGVSLAWSASVSNGSLTLSSTNGSLAAGAATNITASTNANTGALVGGLYSNLVSFINLTNGSGTTNVLWTILVRDGIGDAWRQLYFGHVEPAAYDQSRAQDDPDGDGFSNLQEYLAGTDPTNSTSALRITSAVPQGFDVLVTWSIVTGKTYAIQFAIGDSAGSYSTNFSDLFVVTNFTDTVTNYLDAGAITNSATGYYRVRLVPQ